MSDEGTGVRQLRLVIHAQDYEATLRFFRDAFGMPEQEAYAGERGALVAILDAGRATLEIANAAQVEMIDDVEVGRRVAPPLRIALQVDDAAAATAAAVGGRRQTGRARQPRHRGARSTLASTPPEGSTWPCSRILTRALLIPSGRPTGQRRAVVIAPEWRLTEGHRVRRGSALEAGHRRADPQAPGQ